MIPSPPQEAAQVRGETLEPVSPKPVHYPSPSNIPILERQMDPAMFNDTTAQIGQPTPFQNMPQQSYPSADPSLATSIYSEKDGTIGTHGMAPNGGPNNGTEDYAQSYILDGGAISSTQGTNSIQAFSNPQNPTAPAFSETAPSKPFTSNHIPGNPQEEPSISALDTAPDYGSNGALNYHDSLNSLLFAISNGQSHEGDPNATQSYNQYTDPSTPATALPTHPNLPPRPPPQEKPSTHPNYAPEDDIRSYHPHSQKSQSSSYRANTGLTPLMTATPGSTTTHSFQQTPLSATLHTQTPSTPGARGGAHSEHEANRDDEGDEDIPWPPEIQRLYDIFLVDERANVTEGQWDKFPAGSRLFIGNLPTEKVTKRDLFHIFHKHGKLAQISLKQAYGFVQFMDASSCRTALSVEQGQPVRGRKMHLEISKPQRNTGNAKNDRGGGGGARRRSRSPDYSRGSGQQRGVDRYTGGQGSPRDRDFRRSRDDYRPGRSPSPRGGRRRDRSRDRYRRSRSRSPPGRSRYRSPSPRRETDDDLPLPRRAPQDVPDIQIIVLDDLDRNFIAWAEHAFKERGVRVDVLILSPRLSEAAVVRRQIVEGVLAVSRLTFSNQEKAKIPLQVFDRSAGENNVRFEEYADIDPPIAAELVLRAKQSSVIAKAQYGLPVNYGMPQQPAAPPAQHFATPQSAGGLPPNLSSAISSLDGPALQQLLSAMQQNNQAPQPPQNVASGVTPDLSRLLRSPTTQHNPYGGQQPPPPAAQPNPYANLAGLLGGAAPQQQQPQQRQPQQQQQAPPQSPAQTQPDMAQLMAQLQNYRR